MTTLITGEEWRSMDEASRHYDPTAFQGELDAARARIRRIRMEDCTVIVTGLDGRPLAGAAVEVIQTRPGFAWGEQLWAMSTWQRYGQGESDTIRHYSRLFRELLTAANCLCYWTERPMHDGPKSEEFQGEPTHEVFAWQVDWALRNGLTPKGHPLFWSIPKAIPDWVKRYPIETQMRFLEVRIRDLVARHRGRVKLWDVINEPLWEAAPKHLAQRVWPHVETVDDLCEYIVPVLRWAREEDPAAAYVINDYGLEIDPPGRDLRAADGSPVTAARQRQRFVDLAHRLRDQGAAPDALGMQAHTGGWIDPSTQTAILDDLARAGLPLHYTEFWASDQHLRDAKLDPKVIDAMRAEYIANICTVAFAHERVDAFFFWGAITRVMGFRLDQPGVPNSSNNPSLVYQRLKGLLRGEWMTRERLVSDGDGRVRFRGFHGDYELHAATRSGMPVGTAFRITKGVPAQATLRLAV